MRPLAILPSVLVALAALAAPACPQSTPTPGEPAPPDAARAGDGFSHALFDAVLRDHVEDGLVDYVALRGDARFGEYVRRLAEARPESLKDRKEALAFWLNAYNALTLDGILKALDVSDPAKVAAWRTNAGDGRFFEEATRRVGGKDLSLDAIEHEIVRKRFAGEPRVHFALVCASSSCPKLRAEAYAAARLDAQLEEEARAFLRDPDKNRYDPKTNTLHLSPIFDWFAADFEPAGGRLAFVRERLPGVAADAKIEFLDYDWRLNARPAGKGGG
jgi:hypothetical protein